MGCIIYIVNISHVPSFDTKLIDLNQFILDLVEEYQFGRIESWDDLEKKAKNFFTSEKMDETEAIAPGWHKMASFADGVTLTHVVCVFLGLFMLPEFQALNPDEQQLAKWTVLFHDVQKEVMKGKRDPKHGFRSAITVATNLPKAGFAVSPEYNNLLHSWKALTYSAIITPENFSEPIQDNTKLPSILSGIDQLFGEDTPAALIVKTVLLHLSINVVDDWPQAAPLSNNEIKNYINGNILPLLRVMMLADNEGWVMFNPNNRKKQRDETLRTFEEVKMLITG